MEKLAVQVQMLDSTLEKIEEMKKTLNTTNRSEIVKRSVEIAKIVTDAMSKGGEVIIRDSHDREKILTIPGI